MLEILLEEILSNRINEMNSHAANAITVRGYHPEHSIPSDFLNAEWFLPFNEIPIKYCPTDRYSYLHKYELPPPKNKTWSALKGRILDEAYDRFIKMLHKYLDGTSLSHLDVQSGLQPTNDEFLKKKSEMIQSQLPNLQDVPDSQDLADFNKLLENILRYETQMASTLADYTISQNADLAATTLHMLLFPFVSKPTFTVVHFGITEKAQPDFLYNNKIIMDVKSPPWNDQYYSVLGGYALAWEMNTNRDMNLGTIIMPDFNPKRRVPLYFKSKVVEIRDVYRKAFLLRREKLLELMKKKTDPGIPDDTTDCKMCPYYTHCIGP